VSSTEDLYQIADELRAVASLGLRYTESRYDRGRYERVLAASARLVAALEQRSPDEVLLQFQDNLLHVSPLAGAEAAVFRDGSLLLLRRHDDGLWALPGGLVEVGETLAETACRELWEEVGMRGRVAGLLGIWDSRFTRSQTKAHMYHAVFLVDAADGMPAPSQEATAVAFCAEDELPPLSPGHHVRVPFVFKLVRGEVAVPYFDSGDEAGCAMRNV
jgi:ADP-ribose pyrophosphatase YjhB (NUDIX family)